MASSAKGKEKVIDGYGSKAAAKRKRSHTGGNASRKRDRSVLQFFEDAADECDDDASEDFLFGDDFLEDEFAGSGSASCSKVPNDLEKAPSLPFIPKEEQITEEEFDKMLEERYKPGSNFLTYAEDSYENKRSIETTTYMPSAKDAVIWKVKCMVGRERHSAFCLMQKYVDLKYLGTKLQIISAFALDHVKGFIYIEAEKQSDIYEACNGLCSIYSSRVMPVPKDETSHLFSVRSKGNGISEGTWARVKSGTYKGDLSQVVAVNETRKKVTVKLIPRIDLQAMAQKFGRGITTHKVAVPAPRLISSSELEEFRPLIQYRRDRDTNKIFEVLDGMLLKDGYLYKKVSMDSLNFWGVTPTEDELLKFEPSKNGECNDLDWLSKLYGEKKKKRPVISGKGSGKGEGSSSFIMENKFEVHDLVFFGRKDFGVIIGSEKDNSFKIIKEGSEGPVAVTVQVRELKNAEFDKKLFTALDQQLKNISVNDTVRVLDGPSKDKQGVVKKIYRGIVFLYNETEEENNGYICTKARFCEKVEPAGGACNEKSDEPRSSGFDDFSASPKSPLSPDRSQREKGGSSKFNKDDNAMFSIGQLLRIRVGPLKGYLCRVLAVRCSDVTVKLDSQHKILTVKCEHLSEVRGKSYGISTGVDGDSAKSFDLLGAQDGSGDWMDGAATATTAKGGSWNSGGFSAERSSWPAFPASNSSHQQQSASSFTPKSADEDANKGDSSWEVKATLSQGSSWGATGAAHETVAGTEQLSGWGSQKKAASSAGFGDGASDSWGKAVESHHQTSCQGFKDDSWSRAAGNLSCKDDSDANKSAWNCFGASPEKQNTGHVNAGQISDQTEDAAWNKSATLNEVQTNSWGSIKKDEGSSGGWGKKASTWAKAGENEEKGSSEENKREPWGSSAASLDGQSRGWKKPADVTHGSSPLNEQDGESSWGRMKKGEGSSGGWGQKASTWGKAVGNEEKGTSEKNKTKPWGISTEKWGKNDSYTGNTIGVGGSSASLDGQSGGWNKPAEVTHGSSHLNKQDRQSSWSKQSGESSWSKQNLAGWSSSWSKQDGGSSWNRGDGGASWNSSAGMGNKDDTDQQEGWGRPKAFDGGRGSGGRRGRGGGRGGRDQFGRGRSFSQGQRSNWTKGDQDDHGSSEGMFGENKSSWTTSGQAGSWGNKENIGQDKAIESGEDTASIWNKGWAAERNPSEEGSKWGNAEPGSSTGFNCGEGNAGNQSSGWLSKGNFNESEPSDKTWSSSWNKGSVTIERKGEDDQASGWEKTETPVENSNSPWESSRNSLDKSHSSAWGSQSNWGTPKACLDKNTGDGDNIGGGSNSKKSSEGGSSSAWGQSKWCGATDAAGNQGSWRSQSNWSSENNFGGSDEQTDTFGDKESGGSWRGGRGGRWGSDGGRFGDRGGSDRGGFRGRGRSDRGGFGGRGPESRDFRGRGRFGGKGCGRSAPSDGCASGSSWGQPSHESTKGSAWGQPSSSNSSSWGQPSSGRGSSWGQPCSDCLQGSSWVQPSDESSKGSAWGQPSNGSIKGGSWGQPIDESSKGSAWGQPSNGSGKGSSWGQPSDGCSKGSAWGQPSNGSGNGSSWDKPSDGSDKGSARCGKGSSLDKPSDGSDKGSAGGQPSNGSGKGSSWDKPSDGSDKGSGWGGQPGNGRNKGSAGSSWDKPSDGSEKGSAWGQPRGGSDKGGW